jgi:hypothetical protein
MYSFTLDEVGLKLLFSSPHPFNTKNAYKTKEACKINLKNVILYA